MGIIVLDGCCLLSQEAKTEMVPLEKPIHGAKQVQQDSLPFPLPHCLIHSVLPAEEGSGTGHQDGR